MADLKPDTTLSAEDFRTLQKERDKLQAEVTRLNALLDRSTAGVALLTEAAFLALDFMASSANPFVDREQQRIRAILHMEDALAVNGCETARFDVRSDAN